jgi:hypothetical protein
MLVRHFMCELRIKGSKAVTETKSFAIRAKQNFIHSPVFLSNINQTPPQPAVP